MVHIFFAFKIIIYHNLKIVDEANMKDEKGIYYYPDPSNTKVRVYVRNGDNDEIEFRLWQRDHAHVWDKHQWLSAAVIREAAGMYKELGRGEADPMMLYDSVVAKALLKEENSE